MGGGKILKFTHTIYRNKNQIFAIMSEIIRDSPISQANEIFSPLHEICIKRVVCRYGVFCLATLPITYFYSNDGRWLKTGGGRCLNITKSDFVISTILKILRGSCVDFIKGIPFGRRNVNDEVDVRQISII